MTPADCDLQDFPFMPLMVTRLRKSKAWVKAKRNPALGFYMINLWCAAWHEVPAGSLEDDDDVLADAAMCEPAKWEKARADVLRGWVKCDDGRLYHPVVAERVLEAWKAKQERQEKNAHEAARKALEREERAKHFATLKAAGIHKPWTTGLTELRQLVQNLSAGQVPDVRDPSRLGEGQGEGYGQGEGEGQGELKEVAPLPPPAPRPRAPKPSAKADAPSPSVAVWNAYSDAYTVRYGAEPVRNAKVNGQIAQIVARLGAQEAPHVATFYVGHNAQFYVKAMHSVGLLLTDCEKLRTEWATNRQMTATKAQQVDKTETNYGAFQSLIEAAEARERANAQQ